VAGRLARFARVATTLPQAAGDGGDDGDAVQATVEGLLLGSYRFDRYKGKGTDPKETAQALADVIVLGDGRGNGDAKQALDRARIVAGSVAWARDLVNTPALDATPVHLAKEARRMAREAGLQVKIWSEAELERGGFGGIVGVGRGSVNP